MRKQLCCFLLRSTDDRDRRMLEKNFNFLNRYKVIELILLSAKVALIIID